MYASGRGVEQRFDQSAPSSTSSTFLPSSLLARLTSPRSDSAAAHNFALAAATGDSFAQVLLPLMLLLLMQL